MEAKFKTFESGDEEELIDSIVEYLSIRMGYRHLDTIVEVKSYYIFRSCHFKDIEINFDKIWNKFAKKIWVIIIYPPFVHRGVRQSFFNGGNFLPYLSNIMIWYFSITSPYVIDFLP